MTQHLTSQPCDHPPIARELLRSILEEVPSEERWQRTTTYRCAFCGEEWEQIVGEQREWVEIVMPEESD